MIAMILHGITGPWYQSMGTIFIIVEVADEYHALVS